MRFGWLILGSVAAFGALFGGVTAFGEESVASRWDIHSGHVVDALVRHARDDHRSGANTDEIARNLKMSITPVWFVAGQDRVLSGAEMKGLKSRAAFCRLDLITGESISRLIAAKADGESNERVGKMRVLAARSSAADRKIVIQFDADAQSGEALLFSKIECEGVAMTEIPALLALASPAREQTQPLVVAVAALQK